MASNSNGKLVSINGVEKKIKSIVLTSTGSGSDYSNLQIKEEDYPKLEKNDQVIVRIKASGLNFAELMQRQGLYKPMSKTPYTPGYEGSGVVEEVAENVTDIKVDDRVLVFGSSNLWKEVVTVPRSNVVKIPNDMSFEDAAGLIVNYVTAYQILFRLANLRSGDSVLIHMAAGGVGTAAIQLCKTVPNVKIFGTASAAKHDAIREIGVDYPIDYTTTNYVDEVKKISPAGVDIVLDPLNGENAIKGYDLLKPLGRIIHYGAASMTGESRSLMSAFKTWYKSLSVNSLEIMSENKSMSGYHLGVLLQNEAFNETAITDLHKIIELYEQQKIKIKIDSTFSFSKIGEAMKRMHSRLNIGKIILKPDTEIQPPITPEEVKITPSSTLSSEKDTPIENETKAEKTETVVQKKQAPVIEKVNEPVIVKKEPEPVIEKTKEEAVENDKKETLLNGHKENVQPTEDNLLVVETEKLTLKDQEKKDKPEENLENSKHEDQPEEESKTN